MANYGTMVITNQGLALYAKVQSGISLNFTRMRIGSGLLTGQNPATLLNLITPIAYFTINSISSTTNTAHVKGIFDNTLIVSSTYSCELGLFAQDPDVGEILYAYANAGAEGDTIPPFASGPFSWQYQLNAAIGNAANVTATIPSTSYIPVTDKGVAFGVATLDGSTKLPLAQVPTGISALNIADGSVTDIEFQYINTLSSNVQTQIDNHIADYTLQIPYGGTTTGTTNVYATASPPISVLSVGMAISVKIHVASTGASTLNWSGRGPKGIKKVDGSNLTNLKLNGIYTFRYDGTNFIAQGEGGSGNATASNLLSGKTASTDVGDIVGTMPLKDGSNGDGGTANYHVAKELFGSAGRVYLRPIVVSSVNPTAFNGDIWIIGDDPDFIAANIPLNINMFGLVGTGTNAKRSASGTGTGSSGFTITGLAFQPSKVIASVYDSAGANYIYVLSKTSDIYQMSALGGTLVSAVSGSRSGGDTSTNVLDFATTITSSGFSLTGQPATATIRWFAYE